MSPVFAHGQLRLYLLALLDEGPRHGYEVIQDLEQRFGGLYSPSAGTVYPRLAKLEEEGLVERSDEGRKATYSITAAGRAEVAQRRAEIENLRRDLDTTVRRLADQVRAQVHGSTADLRAELREAARAARAQATPATGTGTRTDDWTPWAGPWAGPWGGAAGAPGAGGGAGEAAGAAPDDETTPGAGAGTARPDLDRTVEYLRRQTRDAWRKHGLTPEQTQEIAAIVSDASRRIAEVLARR